MPARPWSLLVCLLGSATLIGCAADPVPRAVLATPLQETNAAKSSADVQRELESAGWLTLPRTGAVRNPTLNFILPTSWEQVEGITLVTTRAVLGADPQERTPSRTVTSQWEVNCKAATARVVQTETSLDLMGQRKVDKTDASSLPMRPLAAVPMAGQVAALACPAPPSAGSGVVVAPGQVLTASVITRLCLGVDVVMGGQRFPATLTTDDANNHQSMVTAPNLPMKRALTLGQVAKGGQPVVVAGYRPGGSLLGDVELTPGFIQAQPPSGASNITPLSALLLPSQVGGPLLNRSGQFLGVVLGRPVGFAAVQPEVVNAFLTLSWASLPVAKPAPNLSNDTLLQRARDITVKVECLGRPAPLVGSR